MFGFFKSKKRPEPPPIPAATDGTPPRAEVDPLDMWPSDTWPGISPDATADAPLAYSVDACIRTDVGCTRPVNQDSGAIVYPPDGTQRGVLIAVADGMGGHKGGEVASQKAIEVISRVYYETNSDPRTQLKQALEQANREIHAQSQEGEQWRGMGTTCTALALRDGFAYSAHVGDSRMYLIRGGEIYLMTEDHSAVMELVKQGVLSLAEARHHSEKNVITRAIGSRPQVDVYTWPDALPVREGDRFVICSDGLYDRMEDYEIRDIASAAPAASASETLVQLARQRGGYDNITVAVVNLGSPAAATAGPAAETQAEMKAVPSTREAEVQSW
jgi:PPM family protein phosphatase